MEAISVISTCEYSLKSHTSSRIRMTTMIAVAALVVISRPAPAKAFDSGRLLPAKHAFENQVALHWGRNRAWRLASHLPGRLGTISAAAVDAHRETVGGFASFGNSARCDIILADLCREWRHLVPGAPKAPDQKKSRREKVATLALREKFRVYLVRRGDSLWDIARQFDMDYRTLATINGLKTGAVLQVGRPLKVAVSSSRELTLDLTSGTLANHPSLLDQIRLIDGRPVPHWMVTDYVADIIDKRSPEAENRDWLAGMEPLTIVIHFQLVKNLLEGRARLYQPLIVTHAKKYDLDPALVMAMIHTESAFNPHARSNASAYGLMQLVPQTAAKEAYYRIYGQRRMPTPEYLFDPDNNIELGTAYLHILSSRYLGSIADPLSRIYCTVAAYHAGPSSVGRAFTAQPSIKQAALIINSLTPADVYKRLVEALPSVESRNYLRDVIRRFHRYSVRYLKSNDVQASNNLDLASI